MDLSDDRDRTPRARRTLRISTLAAAAALTFACGPIGCDRDEPDGPVIAPAAASDKRPARSDDARAAARAAPLAATQPAGDAAGAPGGDRPRFVVGKLDKSIAESSGIVPSRQYPGVFWTHSDSGNAPVIFAVARDGTLIADFTTTVPNGDWEDIAVDDAGHLYVGDIGNNAGRLAQRQVHRINEPDPYADDAVRERTDDKGKKKGKKRKGDRVGVEATWWLRFPDEAFDAEALFIRGDFGYVISKRMNFQRAGLYRFPLAETNDPITLEKIADLPIHTPVTGASITPDGKWLAVVSVAGPYLFQIDGDPAKAAAVAPAHLTYLHPKMEAICFAPDGLLATTEERDVLLFPWPAFTGGLVPPAAATTHPATSPAP